MHHATRKSRQRRFGFTLSELLIALAILGVIASLAIPSVIKNIDEAQNEAKFKEAIALLEQIGNEAYMEGVYGRVRWHYFIDRANVIKACSNNGLTEGCTANIAANSGDEAKQRAFVLANGVVVGGIDSATGYNQFFEGESWFIDINGTEGPNTYGQDVIRVSAPRFDDNGGMNPDCSSRRLICPNGGAASIALYNNLYR
jgi:prepilin-type N-terminal cleavage/methylation domain-containing protein